MDKDLTIIYITASQIPKGFAEWNRQNLMDQVGDFPIIAISREPIDFGDINTIDDKPKSLSNIYWQMLQAAKMADTPFVAMAEDDTCYHREHFTSFRPDMDTFAYDQNRFALFTWGKPMYSWRNRKSNCSLVAPRELLIEALEERFKKWPEGTPDGITGEVGRPMVEKNMGITIRKSVEYFSKVSLIQFNHDFSSEERQRTHRKSYGPIRAYDIPHWGKAEDLVTKFK